jgi:hypothetical protein
MSVEIHLLQNTFHDKSDDRAEDTPLVEMGEKGEISASHSGQYDNTEPLKQKATLFRLRNP